MSKLDEIFEHKSREVERAKAAISLAEVKRMAADAPDVRPFRAALEHSSNPLALIAEVKKASPSKGLIRANFDPAEVAEAYRRAGADCLSVLTDEKYFQGSRRNLELARSASGLPCLRKDFIYDPYQIYEARSWGADCVLLIVAGFEPHSSVSRLVVSEPHSSVSRFVDPEPHSSVSRFVDNGATSARPETEEGGWGVEVPPTHNVALLRELHETAKSLGMDVLVEVHSRTEAEIALAIDADLIGVNNRNLADMTTSLATSEELLPMLAPHALTVSESALETTADLSRVKAAGARAVLIGTSFCSAPDIEAKVREVMGW